MEKSDAKRCAHEQCSCAFENGSGILFEGETFCSSGCAMGHGCEHRDCQCGAAGAVPDPEGFSAGGGTPAA